MTGQVEVETGAWAVMVFRPQAAAIGADNIAADR
jgi:hypothetical protein